MQATTGAVVVYNSQSAMDTKHKLIVEQRFHNWVSGFGQLAELAGKAQ